MPVWIVCALVVAAVVTAWGIWYAFINLSDVDRSYRSLFDQQK